MEYQNPVLAVEGVDHGDPAVLKHEGIYYLYHTGETEIPVYRSTNLIDWEYCGPALCVSDDPDHWAQIQLWAPEVIYENGTFYMYVAAARKRADGSADDDIRRIGVATSPHPLGPFQWEAVPLTDAWSIDAHPFKDEDGTYYLFYNVRNEHTRGPNGAVGCGNVVDRMIDLKTLAGKPALVVKPEFSWEGNKEQTWFWNEGPFVLKKDGTYYQMYSAGFYGDDTYGIYVAASRVPLGQGGMSDNSWSKWEGGKPLLRSNGTCFGPGHHVVVKGPNGIDDYVVHHGYPKGAIGKGRRVYVSRMHWKDGTIVIEQPTPGARPYPKQATFDGRRMEAAEPLNAQLSSHRYEHFLFETNITVCTEEASGAIFAEDQRFVWRWTFDTAARQLRFQSGDETTVIPLSDDYRFEVSHQLQIWKQAGTIRFMLDRVCRYEAIAPVGYAFVQLSQEDGAQYKGTILQHLTAL